MRIKDAQQNFLGIWIQLVLENKPFEIWEGHHLRDLNYVDDVVDAFLLAAEKEEANGQVYNMGNVAPIKLTSLGDMLITLNGSGKFIEKEYPPERKKIDIGDYYSDYHKITGSLGWSPKIQLRDGLNQTLNYYREYITHYL
jgi:nucleoside-diphosphate-sugar epimerase